MFSSLDEEIQKQEEATPLEHRTHVIRRVEFYALIGGISIVLFVVLYEVIRLVE